MVRDMMEFLSQSPSAFHAVRNLAGMLEKAGYRRLKESEKWNLAAGDKVYVTRNLSSLIAFIVPREGFSSVRIAASHCDSPVFKIKEKAELEVRGKYVQLDTERYGGMIMSTWFDRPLSVAGRVLVKTEKGVETRLVNLDEDTLMIPNVAIHMNRGINDGYKYNAQSDLMPLFGSIAAKGTFMKRIAENCGASAEDILGHDLYLYSRTAPTGWGTDGEFVSAGRLDDLECAYTTARAMADCAPAHGMPVLAVFDNEEVGSTTKQGADSTFLTDVLRRAAACMGASEEDFLRAQANSLMLSCDNAHAVHPNHPEFSDAVNCSFMNEGIVIKESANQKYTSDGASKAVFRAILDRANVPYQFFANRSDMIGGGTLGNIANSHFSLNTVDIGLPQLAMHSCYETAGVKDVESMIRGVRAFFEADVKTDADGEFIIG